jgi:hypothetical protein
MVLVSTSATSLNGPSLDAALARSECLLHLDIGHKIRLRDNDDQAMQAPPPTPGAGD